jgi:hypothetical protein
VRGLKLAVLFHHLFRPLRPSGNKNIRPLNRNAKPKTSNEIPKVFITTAFADRRILATVQFTDANLSE